MLLESLVINRGPQSTREIKFKPGLNLILDKPTSVSQTSGNNIGKTTVLRLIDYCLGSSGEDIWTDSEFKDNKNKEVYDYLHHPSNPVSITLSIKSPQTGQAHEISRTFSTTGFTRDEKLSVDSIDFPTLDKFKSKIKFLLFGSQGKKPQLRHLVPKFVRSSQERMSKTLKFIHFGKASDYEVTHLFLFGFTAVSTLEDRPKYAKELKQLQGDLKTLRRLRKEGEIEQLLIHLRQEVKELSQSSSIQGKVSQLTQNAERVSAIRSKASNSAAKLARLNGELHSIYDSIANLESSYSDIDKKVIESIYKDAERFIPELHHEWNELTDFVNNLSDRKKRFLELQADSLSKQIREIEKELLDLQNQEKSEIGDLMSSPEFLKAIEIRSELQEKLKSVGRLEQTLDDINSVKRKITEVKKLIRETSEVIENNKSKLQDHISLFNKHFSTFSKSLYGEKYLLHFEESSKGNIEFQLTSVGANVGTGKKVSQTAAFDLAYTEYVAEKGSNFPLFVCHDGMESIHGNQLSELLVLATKSSGQFVLATLRDKLPKDILEIAQENVILELSQEEKLFRI